MLLALTGYETALLVVALAFIAFALVAALLIPRSRPSFPSTRLGVFLAICGVFFVAQMTAVLVLAEVGEADEPVAEESIGGEDTETTPTETETTATETTATETTETSEGDPVAGKEVFLGTAGCTGCHTLSDAGATGTIGPNLDAARPPYDLVVERVTNGQGAMPAFADTLTPKQIQDVAAYVSSVAGS